MLSLFDESIPDLHGEVSLVGGFLYAGNIISADMDAGQLRQSRVSK